jgi:hypothetical protein
MSDVKAVSKKAGIIVGGGINNQFVIFCVVLWLQVGNLIVTQRTCSSDLESGM